MENLTTYEKIYGERYEKQITLDSHLPEYLPGISKIIRVSAVPDTERCEFANGIDVSGRVVFTVLYESEFDGSLKCATFNCDFDHHFSKPSQEEKGDECFLECSVKSYGESARMSDARRVSLSCTLVMEPLATACKKSELFQVQENGTLKKKSNTAQCMKIVPLQGCEVIMRENVYVPQGMPPIKDIIFCDGQMMVRNAYVADGKANFDGVLHYTCMYLAEDSEANNGYAVFSGDVPLKSSSDIEISMSDSQIVCDITPVRISAEPSVNSYGDSNGCRIEAQGRITGKIYGNTEISVIEDVFCTKHDCNAQVKELPSDVFVKVINSTQTLNESVRAELGSMTDVVSCSVDVQDVRTEITGGEISAVCNAVLRVLGSNPEGNLEYRSSKFNFRQSHGEVPSDINDRYHIESKVQVHLDEAKIENGEIKCSLLSCLSSAVCSEKRICAVTALEIDDSSEYVRDKSEYVIYYPTEDESIWSVAKRYKTDPSDIIKANGLKQGEKINKSCVVIPR